jgi:hypothetical protein
VSTRPQRWTSLCSGPRRRPSSHVLAALGALNPPRRRETSESRTWLDVGGRSRRQSKSVSRAIQIAPNPNRTNAPRSRSSALPQEIRSPHGSWRSGKPPCRFASREGEKAGGVPQEGASSSAPVPRLAAAVFWHVRGSPVTPNPSQASSITALPVPWCAPAAQCSTLHTREPCGSLPISALLPSSEGMRSADWTGQHSAASLSLSSIPLTLFYTYACRRRGDVHVRIGVITAPGTTKKSPGPREGKCSVVCSLSAFEA